MKRMFDEQEIIKIAEEHGGGGDVNSVNSKTGDVVLDATDIKLTTNQQTIQNNIIRIDESLDLKQDVLTAGTGIDITNGVISVSFGQAESEDF